MKNEINAVLENMTATAPEPEDYTGEDGLLSVSYTHLAVAGLAPATAASGYIHCLYMNLL